MHDKRTKINADGLARSLRDASLFLEFTLPIGHNNQRYICHLAKVVRVISSTIIHQSPDPAVCLAYERQGNVPIYRLPLTHSPRSRMPFEAAVLFQDAQKIYGILVTQVARTRVIRWDQIQPWSDETNYACGVHPYQESSLWLLDIDRIYTHVINHNSSNPENSPHDTDAAHGRYVTEHCRLAIIDDSSCQRASLSHLLSSQNFQAKPFKSAAEFIKAQDNEWIPYATIIIDVEMPEINGIALTRTLRADSRYTATPIILWTGLDGKIVEKEALQAGANCLIPKFNVKNLTDALYRFVKTRS